jgi:invasion protein IalB
MRAGQEIFMSDFETPSEPAPAPEPAESGLRLILIVLGVLVLLLLAVVLGLFAWRYFAPKNANEVQISKYGDWEIVCAPASQKDGDCTLTSSVLREDGGTVMNLSIIDTGKDAKLTVVVPLGVLLPSGLGFSVGDESLEVQSYETCTSVGCVAQVPLTQTRVAALNKGSSGQIVVVPNNGSPVSVAFSLKGFSDGYAKLDRAKARRKSFWKFLGI